MIIFVAGLAKGGTTTLESLLRKHARHPVKNKNKEPGVGSTQDLLTLCVLEITLI